MNHPRLWRNRNFRFFIAASLFAQPGSGVFAVAFPWFATLLTRDPLLIGMVAMAPQLPWLLFALPAYFVNTAVFGGRIGPGAGLFMESWGLSPSFNPVLATNLLLAGNMATSNVANFVSHNAKKLARIITIG